MPLSRQDLYNKFDQGKNTERVAREVDAGTAVVRRHHREYQNIQGHGKQKQGHFLKTFEAAEVKGIRALRKGTLRFYEAFRGGSNPEVGGVMTRVAEDWVKSADDLWSYHSTEGDARKHVADDSFAVSAARQVYGIETGFNCLDIDPMGSKIAGEIIKGGAMNLLRRDQPCLLFLTAYCGNAHCRNPVTREAVVRMFGVSRPSIVDFKRLVEKTAAANGFHCKLVLVIPLLHPDDGPHTAPMFRFSFLLTHKSLVRSA